MMIYQAGMVRKMTGMTWLLLLLLVSIRVDAGNHYCPVIYADLQIARQVVLDAQNVRARKILQHAQQELRVNMPQSERDQSLHRLISEDINAALRSISLESPDHAATLEAVQSAINLCMPEQDLSHGVMKAYADVVNAYVMDSSPHFRPEQHKKADAYLKDARDILQKQADTAELARLVQQQINRYPPDVEEMKILLDVMQLHVQQKT